LNARLRKAYLNKGMKAAYIGADIPSDFTYPVTHLGDTPKVLEGILKGAWGPLKDAQKPLILVGQDALSRDDSASIMGLVWKICEKFNLNREGWNGFNVLQKAASRVAGLDLNLLPQAKGYGTAQMIEKFEKGSLKLLYLLGADEIDIKKPKDGIIIYQGHHGDRGAALADIILPGCAYTEKSGTYINTEGRVQRTQRAIFPPKDAREDWKILRALGEAASIKLPYDTVDQLRASHPLFTSVGIIPPVTWEKFGESGETSDTPFTRSQKTFYMTDPISRHSPTMAKCLDALGGSHG
jgi:NADH-quinone oxidoreductase subunit G